MTYHKLLIALLIGATNCSAADNSASGNEYFDRLARQLNELMSDGPFFYHLCEYEDANGYVGGVMFAEFSGVDYYLEFDRSNGQPLQIVPYRRTSSTISLGTHWGGDGSGNRIRDFLTRNSASLDGPWRYSQGVIPNKEFVAGKLENCQPPKT